VYWGSKTGEGPLAPHLLASYEQKGYLSLRGFFSPQEVREWRDELNRLWGENRDSDRKEVIREPGSQEIRSIFAVHRDNEVFDFIGRKLSLQWSTAASSRFPPIICFLRGENAR
jgi:ectoine hydroxylase